MCINQSALNIIHDNVVQIISSHWSLPCNSVTIDQSSVDNALSDKLNELCRNK